MKCPRCEDVWSHAVDVSCFVCGGRMVHGYIPEGNAGYWRHKPDAMYAGSVAGSFDLGNLEPVNYPF